MGSWAFDKFQLDNAKLQQALIGEVLADNKTNKEDTILVNNPAFFFKVAANDEYKVSQ
jgi:hypothetical protein